MDEYTVEDIVVSLTRAEYENVWDCIMCTANEGFPVVDTLWDKFKFPYVSGGNTRGFLQGVDDDDPNETFILKTDQPQGD